MSKPSWVSEETPKVGNEDLGGMIAFGVALTLAVLVTKGVGWLFKKIEEGVKKLKEKHAKHVEATTGVNGYVLELKKNDAHLKERLSGFHKPFSALSKDQILTMLKGLVNKQYHDALSHLSDSVLKTPEAIVSIALMCHHSIDPVYLKHIISNSLFTKDPILLGFMANSGYKSYTTLSWHDGLYRKSGTKLSQSAITVAARLVTIYKEVNSLVDGPHVSDEMRKYLKTHKKEIEALYEKAEDIWADVSNLYYDKKYVIDIPEKDYEMVDVLNKDALTLGRIFCDLGTMEHVLKTQEVAGKKFDDSSRFIFNLDYANSSLQTDNFDLEKGIKEDVNTWEMLEKLLGTMYGMIQTLGYVGFEYEYAASEILDSSHHTLACYKAMDKIMDKMKDAMPSVALESWFSSKPKHSVIDDAQKHIDERLKKLVAYVKENHVIENYHKMQKLVANVKMSPEQAKAFVLKHIEEDYEKEVEKLPASVFSSAAVAYGIKIVTVSPCQEDYESDYVCLKRILKSSAFNSQPILTAIASQTGMLSSELSYLLDNGVKLGQFLDKATELAKAKNKTALASHYEAFCQDLEFEHWGYCFRDSSPIEDHNGLKLVTALTTSVPIQTMEHLFEKMKELIAADVGSNDKAVVGFAHVILSIFNDVMSLYRTCNEFTNECLRDLEKVGTEGFADFASETQQVTDFANRYRDEHMLDESYHKINIDAKGSISHQAWISEKGIGNMYEQIDDVPMLDFVALESEGGEGKSLIARLIEKIKQFFIWLAKKVGIYREQEEKVDLGDIKKKHDDIEDQVRKCQSDVVNVKDFKESLRSEAIAKLRMSTQDQKLACYLLDTHYKQADKDTLASIFNTARIWNINPVAAAGLAIIGPYQTVKHYPIISEAIKSLEVIIDSLVKAADTVASNGNGANITALSRLPKVDIDALQSLRQSLSKVYSLENIKDADSDIIKDKDAEQVFSDISNFDKLINKFDGAVEHVTVTLNKLNGNAVKNNDIELEEIGKWLNYTATLVANMISIFNGYRQVFQHQWSWLRRYEQLLIVKYKPAAEGWAGVANQEVQDEDLGMSDLLDTESDTEDFDIEMDNETLGVDDLEDYVSNDVEPAQTEVAVGLEHYGELIATKGMCKEYYVACESLQPGIFSGIQQNRLTALPSRTMQAVALEAVEGEQKKGLIARLIEKIKQFFSWLVKKLGFSSVKKEEIPVKDDFDEVFESMLQTFHDFEHGQGAFKDPEPKEPTGFDKLHLTTPNQLLACLMLDSHYPHDNIDDVVAKLNKSKLWSVAPHIAAGIAILGPYYAIDYDPYMAKALKMLEWNINAITKAAEMLSKGDVSGFDVAELEKLPKLDQAKLEEIRSKAIKVYSIENIETIHEDISKDKNNAAALNEIASFGHAIDALEEKLNHANQLMQNADTQTFVKTDLLAATIGDWIKVTSLNMTGTTSVFNAYIKGFQRQSAWLTRLAEMMVKSKKKAKPATESFGWSQSAADLPNWCIPAMEAIDFQYKSKLFTRLTEEISEIRKRGVFTTKAFLESNIVKIINEETNLQYTLRVYHSSFPDAAVCNFVLDKNNPLIDNEGRPFLSNINLENVKALLGAKTNGWIDYTRGKVGGVFAKIQNSLHVTTGIVADGIYTDEEVAAIFCHEIGHTFTAYSQIANVIGMNYIIQDISDRLKGVADRTVAIDIIHEYDTRYGIKLPAEEITAVMENETKMVTKLVVEVSKWRRNAEGDYVFSARNSEMVADQFAARMGAGRAVVTGLDKMERHYGLSDQYQSRITHVMSQTFSVLIRLVISLAIPPALIFFILGVWLDNPQKKTYDDPIERYTRVRNETIVGLKNSKITSEMKKVLLEDIAEMDRVIKLLNNQKPWFEWIWDNIFPSGKKTVEAMKFQQLIERMGNNDLFMKSASYELLIEDLKNA